MIPSPSLAFSQIQRQTWWYEGNKKPVTARISKPEIIANLGEILAWLKTEKRKVSGSEVAEYFSLTTSQPWHLVDPLVDSGQVIKHKPRHDRTLL